MAEAFDSRFPDWLGVQLRSRGMSIRLLAQRSGVNASTISRIIRGERRPSLQTAIRLASVFRDDTDDPTVTFFARSLTPAAGDPVAAVERALRSDDRLTDAGVGKVMLLYHRVRNAHRLREPR